LPTEPPSNSDFGFFIKTGYSINGVYAGHDLNTDVVVPCCSGPILYAPTLMVPDVNNNARVGCLESVTIHWWGTFASEVAQGFWDHCIKKNWASLKKVDSTWINNYARTFDGELRYFTQVYLGSFGWEGYLYNFNSGVWEVQWTVNSAATPSYNNLGGWTAWESKNLDTSGCWDTKSIRAAPVQIRFTSGVWQNLTSPYGQSFSSTNSCTAAHENFIVNAAQWDWQVNWHP
jgi:hypothetical protein